MAYRTAVNLNLLVKPLSKTPIFPNNPKPLPFVGKTQNSWIGRASLWSMKKDPALEKALKRNRRWTINNQLKNILQRCPQQSASVKFLQRKFNSLDIRQGNVLNWLRKYPCLFDIYTENFEIYCKFTKRVRLLIEEEETLKEQLEPVMAERLAKIIMLTWKKKLNIVKFNDLRKYFELPDDYVLSIVPKYPELFRVSDYNARKNSLEIQLVSWNPSLAVSVVERRAEQMMQKTGQKLVPMFEYRISEGDDSLQAEKFNKFQEAPYISPYSYCEDLEEGSEQHEKRTVGVIHELLSLTMWKRASIAKLAKFQREFRFPRNLVNMLMRHPGIFYVSNKNDSHTVVLRDGYVESELVEKDPLVVAKEKFGELMQEGLYEFTERRRKANLEKRRENRPLWKMNNDFKKLGREIFDNEVEGKEEKYQKEARERFQKAWPGPDAR
ncbi:hypothetical protein SUGI_0520590 [Cryptomeria japonica]|uniref:protein WHAT'S THIS FACTOR 1, chloroplastic n=1 Tax=Cryptomeria japonica TaxID=3369 RepID=UPI002408B5E3|nr:protein WHAT'S THIS FACTOR 1, chloroplastic [Cryptomeria japonica]XP_057822082.2 protein WHAT'S THIS FACTOR 1, chloroplastic [Cryptomeria japonica]XP_057822083.2 protein WHAT'S THIS FACTOR 1, chloroplastic [Cryptomeria japonica]GLJ26722.1 hypothetical protein SUGI_0520590 [Cryptomeria japonica]